MKIKRVECPPPRISLYKSKNGEVVESENGEWYLVTENSSSADGIKLFNLVTGLSVVFNSYAKVRIVKGVFVEEQG